MRCNNCGTYIDDDFKFCTECGAKLEEPKIYCPNCRAVFEVDGNFCGHCGTKLITESEYKQLGLIDYLNKKTSNEKVSSKVNSRIINGEINSKREIYDSILEEHDVQKIIKEIKDRRNGLLDLNYLETPIVKELEYTQENLLEKLSIVRDKSCKKSEIERNISEIDKKISNFCHMGENDFLKHSNFQRTKLDKSIREQVKVELNKLSKEEIEEILKNNKIKPDSTLKTSLIYQILDSISSDKLNQMFIKDSEKNVPDMNYQDFIQQNKLKFKDEIKELEKLKEKENKKLQNYENLDEEENKLINELNELKSKISDAKFKGYIELQEKELRENRNNSSKLTKTQLLKEINLIEIKEKCLYTTSLEYISLNDKEYLFLKGEDIDSIEVLYYELQNNELKFITRKDLNSNTLREYIHLYVTAEPFGEVTLHRYNRDYGYDDYIYVEVELDWIDYEVDFSKDSNIHLEVALKYPKECNFDRFGDYTISYKTKKYNYEFDIFEYGLDTYLE